MVATGSITVIRIDQLYSPCGANVHLHLIAVCVVPLCPRESVSKTAVFAGLTRLPNPQILRFIMLLNGLDNMSLLVGDLDSHLGLTRGSLCPHKSPRS